jgi:integrase
MASAIPRSGVRHERSRSGDAERTRLVLGPRHQEFSRTSGRDCPFADHPGARGTATGQPLSAEGLDEILSAGRVRAGLVHGTCHELRHTCLTRLREGGMTLEALQAQAGHRSLSSTRVYLHLSADWLADEYRRATEAIEAQATIGARR